MKKNLIFAVCFFCVFHLFSQNKITYNGSGNYTLKERTDLRRYDNGKYVGLVRREVTSFITPVSFENGYEYEGNFFLQEDTVHANQEIGLGIRDSIPASFKINKDGVFTMTEDNGFPSFRSFPSFSDKSIKPGDSWTGKAERAVDPLNKGVVTKMPIYVQYTYSGDDYYNGEPVFLLTAQWATRYGMGSGTSYIDWGGDKDLEKATGSHKANIFVSKITGNAVVVKDSCDETFYFSDGNVIQFKGTISLFTEYPPAFDRSKLIPTLKRLCELTDSEAEDLLLIPDTSSQIVMNYEKQFEKTIENSIEESSTDNSSPAISSVSSISSNTVSFPVSAQISSSEKNSERLDALTQKVRRFMENNKSEASNRNKIAVDATPSGIRLSIQDLQFKSNSSELLPGETSRLNQIAELLQTVPDAQLLVEGHTASTGNIIGEKNLSIERAQAIAKALTERGIAAGRFICKGFGGTKPVADNSTSEGKARNRRVEITILD